MHKKSKRKKKHKKIGFFTKGESLEEIHQLESNKELITDDKDKKSEKKVDKISEETIKTIRTKEEINEMINSRNTLEGNNIKNINVNESIRTEKTHIQSELLITSNNKSKKKFDLIEGMGRESFDKSFSQIKEIKDRVTQMEDNMQEIFDFYKSLGISDSIKNERKPNFIRRKATKQLTSTSLDNNNDRPSDSDKNIPLSPNILKRKKIPAPLDINKGRRKSNFYSENKSYVTINEFNL